MKLWRFRLGCRCILTLLLATSHISSSVAGESSVFFSKSFEPLMIGPDNIATLRFDLTNTNELLPAQDIEFDDFLPGDMRVADVPAIKTSCVALVEAGPGSGLISVSNGQLGTGESCSISINIASSSTQTNVTGELTSSLGNSGTASATLTVDPDLPTFQKTFIPAVVTLDTTSRLIFDIDNSSNKSSFDLMSFVDNLPEDLVVANPANATTSCDGGLFPPILTAQPGATSIELTSGFVGSGLQCKVEVDVLATRAGVFDNVTESLELPNQTLAGKAAATLTVVRDFVTKAFVDDPVAPGDIVALEFSLTNFDRFAPAGDIAFSDDLGAMLAGATATNLPLNSACGNGSTVTGTSVITFQGALAPEEACSFVVLVQVPASTEPGSYLNTTSTISTVIDGDTVVLPPAEDTLVVQSKPQFTKSFSSAAVAGGPVTLAFSITNTDSTETLTDIAFDDDLGAMLGGILATLPAPGFCGPGSNMVRTGGIDPQVLSITGGSLDAGNTCMFDVALTLPESAPGGTFLNVTSPLVGLLDGQPIQGDPAQAELTVLAAPQLAKTFVDDPAAPGDSVTLAFTLSHGLNSPGPASDISFTDDLDAVLTGLTAAGGTQNDVCGAGSQLSGNSLLSLSGATLAPGGSCDFSVTVNVPTSASSGAYLNVTSDVNAMVQGVSVTGAPGTDALDIAEIEFESSFVPATGLPGGEIVLRFNLTNSSPTSSATALTFTNDLNAALAGLASISPPANDICGAGSSISGSGTLTFSGGSLAIGATCSFDVLLGIPGNADIGEYINLTSPLDADIGGAVSIPGTSTRFSIVSPLSLQKRFQTDSALPGSQVSLEFTVTNSSPIDTLSNITFSDNLGAMIAGLSALNLPRPDVCGTGSSIGGTGLISLSGGTLPPESACMFVVELLLPGTVSPGIYENVTSFVTSGGVTGEPAVDELEVEELPTDLAIGITNATDVLGNNTPVDYRVAVQNVGLTDVFDAAVGVVVPSEIAGATWNCTTQDAGAQCAAGGNGAVADTVDLPMGARVDYRITGIVQAQNQAQIQVDASVMTTRDVNSANDLASDSDPVDSDLLLQAGFEADESFLIQF